jgi:hypothetical protein
MSPSADPVHLFAYFTDGGQHGLRLAASRDAAAWSVIDGGRPLLVPALGEHRLMRDPHLSRGPDGVFHLLWTTGWDDPFIGHASSTDLVNWSAQRALPVMPPADFPGVRNCWAPEAVYAAADDEWIVVWSSTVPGRFAETADRCEDGYNHRLYAARTRDFATLSPTTLFYDPGFPVIDGSLLRRDGRWHLFFKDETLRPERKTLHHVSAPELAGPWSASSPAIGPAWAEGPAPLDLGDRVLLVYDMYRDGHYGAFVSRDFSAWEKPAAGCALPAGARHGSLLTVPAAALRALVAAVPEFPNHQS